MMVGALASRFEWVPPGSPPIQVPYAGSGTCSGMRPSPVPACVPEAYNPLARSFGCTGMLSRISCCRSGESFRFGVGLPSFGIRWPG